jgi:hypothetical protein
MPVLYNAGLHKMTVMFFNSHVKIILSNSNVKATKLFAGKEVTTNHYQ